MEFINHPTVRNLPRGNENNIHDPYMSINFPNQGNGAI